MNALVTLADGQAVTTSLAIAEGTENQHKNVMELIRTHQAALESFGPLAFETRMGQALPQGGFAKATEYANLNEPQATLLLTMMRNSPIVLAFKVRLVKAFYELAKRSTAADPSTLSRADILRLALDSEEKRIAAEAKVLTLETTVSELEPKAAFARQVEVAPDAITTAQAAKIIGTGRTRFMAWLREIHFLTRFNEPYQDKIEAGLLDVKLGSWDHPDHGLRQSVTTLITGKGLVKLQQMWAVREMSLSLLPLK